jgi:hypothetical protein
VKLENGSDTPGNSDGYERKALAGKAICKVMKTKARPGEQGRKSSWTEMIGDDSEMRP